MISSGALASTRAKTSAAGEPLEAPERTRAARRSISGHLTRTSLFSRLTAMTNGRPFCSRFVQRDPKRLAVLALFQLEREPHRRLSGRHGSVRLASRPVRKYRR